MRTIKWNSCNGMVGSERTGLIEVDDEATDLEIEEAVRDEVFNYFEWGWEEEKAP